MLRNPSFSKQSVIRGLENEDDIHKEALRRPETWGRGFRTQDLDLGFRAGGLGFEGAGYF